MSLVSVCLNREPANRNCSIWFPDSKKATSLIHIGIISQGTVVCDYAVMVYCCQSWPSDWQTVQTVGGRGAAVRAGRVQLAGDGRRLAGRRVTLRRWPSLPCAIGCGDEDSGGCADK